MLILDNILLALASLKANKIRSFLTMLGIVIGIASVIAIVTIGDSMSKSMISSIDEMGVNNIECYVTTKMMDMEGGNAFIRDMKDTDYLTDEVIEKISDKFSSRLSFLSLQTELGNGECQMGKQKFSYQVLGGNAGLIKTKNLKILAGRTISQEEQKKASRVVLIADKAAKAGWGEDLKSALGKNLEVKINDKYYSYTIVGIYQHYVTNFSTKAEACINTEAIVPLKTAINESHSHIGYMNFTVGAAEASDGEMLSTDIREYVNSTFYKTNDTYGLSTNSAQAWKEEAGSMMNSVKTSIAGIAAISLLVGGIGVMNIMIVSITERTREIGTRKALGASKASIRIQFVMEAIVMCVIGGIIGVLLGIGIGIVITFIMGTQGTPSVLVIFGSVLFSAAFGIAFGYYPANRAAKMDPIEALRYE